jgi:futalosine hydrolase
MKLALVAATYKEIEPLTNRIKTDNPFVSTLEIEIIITGVGILNSCFNLTKSMINNKFDLVIQAGVAGSFNKSLNSKSIVIVKDELLGDCGVLENNHWLDLFDMGLEENNNGIWFEKKLSNPYQQLINRFNYQKVTGITVNQVSTNPILIDALIKKYNPDIESMEGAVFHYVCLKEQIPFIQMRAISNIVGDRNKANWKMKEAIEILNSELIQLINELSK